MTDRDPIVYARECAGRAIIAVADWIAAADQIHPSVPPPDRVPGVEGTDRPATATGEDESPARASARPPAGPRPLTDSELRQIRVALEEYADLLDAFGSGIVGDGPDQVATLAALVDNAITAEPHSPTPRLRATVGA